MFSNKILKLNELVNVRDIYEFNVITLFLGKIWNVDGEFNLTWAFNILRSMKV